MMIGERCACLFSLGKSYHTPGCPVVIRDGTLLRDNTTGTLLVQLKLTVVGRRPVQSVTVSLQPLDSWDNPIGNPVIHRFEGYGSRGTDMGLNKTVELPAGSEAFRAAVVQAAYTDGEELVMDDIQSRLSPPEPLERRLTAESCRQFRAINGEDSIYMPIRVNDLWFCTCGELCHESTACHRCGRSTVILQDALDLIAQPPQPETPPKKVIPTGSLPKKRRRIGIIVAAVALVALVVAAVLLIPRLPESAEKAQAYSNALTLLESGNYSDALFVFDALGDYRDSQKQANQIRDIFYEDALRLLENGDYESALAHFREIGDYRDAAQYIARFKETHLLIKETSYLDDELEYVTDRYYNGSRMTKEIFTATDSVCSTFHGLSLWKAGQVTASYTYNFSGSIAGIDLRGDANASISYVYDQQGRLIRETGDNSYAYTYDENGNLIQKLWYNGSTISGTPYCEYNYHYDEYGQVVWASVDFRDFDTHDYEEDFINTYDDQGRIIEHRSSRDTGQTYVYKYDHQGRLIREQVIGNGNNGVYQKGIALYDYHYEYDAFGNLIKKTTYIDGKDSDSVRIITYTYNSTVTYS